MNNEAIEGLILGIVIAVSYLVGKHWTIYSKTVACKNCCDRQSMDRERRRRNSVETIWEKHHG